MQVDNSLTLFCLGFYWVSEPGWGAQSATPTDLKKY